MPTAGRQVLTRPSSVNAPKGSFFVLDVSTILTREIIERVYELVSEAAVVDSSKGAGDLEILDPNHHFFIIDPFEMPNWQWSIERKTFEK